MTGELEINWEGENFELSVGEAISLELVCWGLLLVVLRQPT
jgi:hypothetical protein